MSGGIWRFLELNLAEFAPGRLAALLRTTCGSENDEDLTEDERAATKTAQEKYDKKKEEEVRIN